MNSGWRPKRSFIGQINDFWTSVTNIFPQNRTFWRQKNLRAVARVTNLFCFVSGGGGGRPCTDQQGLAGPQNDLCTGSSLPCNADQCRMQINACMLIMLHMCAYNIKTKKNGNWLGPVMDLFGRLLDLSLENNAFPTALMDLFQKNSSRLIKLIVTARPNLSWHYGIIAKSTLTCTNYGKTGHSMEFYHNMKKEVPIVPTVIVKSIEPM